MVAKAGRDWLGSLLGIGVFLGGVALLVVTFRLAYDMFAVPPSQALGIQSGKPLNVDTAGSSLAGVFIRILLLMAMALMGSWVANRGIALYASARGIHDHVKHHDAG